MPNVVSLSRLLRNGVALVTSSSLCLVIICGSAYADMVGKFPGKGNYQTWLRANDIYDQGTRLAKSGNYDAAIDKLQAAIELYSYDAAYFRNLGSSFAKRDKPGDLASAENAYRNAVDLEPDTWACWYDLGSVLYQQDKNKESLVALRKAMSLKPPDDMVVKIKSSMQKVLAEINAGDNR